MTTLRRRLAAAAAATTLALALAACSGDPSTDDASAAAGDSTASADAEVATHNAADTEFAQMMIVHHQGAIEMADLAVSQGTHPEVKAFGEQISAAQQPEIDQMTEWLQTWGESAQGAMGGMDHGGMEMDGMDQEGAMAELESLSGTEFDQRFLELMIAHHKGAIEMSEQELADGENAEARALARTIIDAQNAEITEMTNLRSDL
ncbi:DUF305 domain-containing protein [Cellulomonas sp. Leaf395]|uniref:DUF305 domain-containing protein n=1 Tax=Cellulomonas sp. Leaf395 TaxID=1736362 RepID=UPI0006F62F64|nr:DUF305 domain-containing protein [Cellulomonas sp. Leaf395]KQS98724.1 hypothetical protein ASG23_13335 [Cellulomonas sp. Leaf395]